MDANAPRDPFGRYFGSLKDPRVKRTREHRLDDIIAIALLAVICPDFAVSRLVRSRRLVV